MRPLTLALLALVACGDDKTTDDTAAPADDSASGGDDSGAETAETADADDTAETADTVETAETGDSGGGEGRGWTTTPLAGLAELSSGACPDLSASGTTSFLSSDEERTVTVVVPAAGGEDAPLVVFFHGLTTPDATPNPTEYMAEALDLQNVADALGVVILLPEAPLRNMFGLEFYLWDVENIEGTDLVLYDDLRTCASDQLGVDLNRVHAFGFSGGALFTTVLAVHRADTLASMVEHSGGSDVELPMYSYILSEYATPAWTLPALLVSGGDADVWPNESYPFVDFEDATDNLASELASDSSFIVRCRHEAGHTITTDGYLLTIDWLDAHVYGEPSPYQESGLGADADWCEAMGG